MDVKNNHQIAVVVLNWNGKEDTLKCLYSLTKQNREHTIIMIDNASSDGLIEEVEQKYPNITVVANKKNLGFAGGVNTGIRQAIERGCEFVALLNNDATADDNWLNNLTKAMESRTKVGIVTGKLLKADGRTIDSTGDYYSIWGLPYPRGRDEAGTGRYEKSEYVFGASGGASLYRIETLKQIGLFDEDFFAYYEDVDLSFRAQLAGWKVYYEPKAIAYHATGTTSGKIKGFTTYQTIKNWPWLFWKNMPARLVLKSLPCFTIAYFSVVVSSLAKGKFVPVAKGLAVSFVLMPKKLVERHRIQKSKTVSNKYIDSILMHDLPPNAAKLHRIRRFFIKRG